VGKLRNLEMKNFIAPALAEGVRGFHCAERTD